MAPRLIQSTSSDVCGYVVCCVNPLPREQDRWTSKSDIQTGCPKVKSKNDV